MPARQGRKEHYNLRKERKFLREELQSSDAELFSAHLASAISLQFVTDPGAFLEGSDSTRPTTIRSAFSLFSWHEH